MEKKVVVVSAISLRSGGTFSILQDCLKELDDNRYGAYKVYAIVKDKNLFLQAFKSIKFIELDGTLSYAKRLYYEYRYFRKLSIQLKPYLWLSLHDVSPNVIASRRAVYCHNASPFYNLSLKEFRMEPKLGFFKLLYKYAYKVNIKKNDFVIVQQEWLRSVFHKSFQIPREKIIVAHPNLQLPSIAKVNRADAQKTFIYPTLPRVFKNIEVIGGAAQLLIEKGITNFKIFVTIDGGENYYAKTIVKRFGHLENIRFIGLQTREKIFGLYSTVDCLLFPSRLESWGLPISEFKATGKPILLSDLPYAYETLGHYERGMFFNPDSKEDLAAKMEHVIVEDYAGFGTHRTTPVDRPMARNWHELFDILLQ